MLTVLDPGPLATIQDLGRGGFAALGVTASGAADRGALRLANALVGNDPGAAAIEATFGGLAVRAERPLLLALSGAAVTLTGTLRQAGVGIAFTLGRGEWIALGRPERGLRTYVAVRGGIGVPAELGSRATDVLGGIGPAPLAAGDVLPIGGDIAGDPPGIGPVPLADPPPELSVRVVPGPRDEWTDIGLLVRARFTVAAASDRIGVRLGGLALPRRPGELLPEGMVRGGIQLPPDGNPVLLGPDHPVTGGYPVVAVVAERDLDAVGQLRPGDIVRFHL